jgi:competence protein ComGC
MNFHFELVDILIGMVVITLILLLTSSDTSNYKSLSKTGQNEEDWRWIRDYVGDGY